MRKATDRNGPAPTVSVSTKALFPDRFESSTQAVAHKHRELNCRIWGLVCGAGDDANDGAKPACLPRLLKPVPGVGSAVRPDHAGHRFQTVLISPMPVSSTARPLATVLTWFQNCQGSE